MLGACEGTVTVALVVPKDFALQDAAITCSVLQQNGCYVCVGL